MKQSANIAASVKTLWTVSALPPLVPGGIVYGAIKADTPYPFATLEIKLAGEPQWQTGRIYVQDYEVTIRIWSDQLVGTQATMQTALEALMGPTTKLALLTDNAWTLMVNLVPEGIEEDDQRNIGTDIFIAGGRWQLSIQEQR